MTEWKVNEKECHFQLIKRCQERVKELNEDFVNACEELSYLHNKMSMEEYKAMWDEKYKEKN